jgi:acyl transferase domain-containing protein/2-polyprenyl-3-methyl-5-hydroxy-6-metoxy-1,4-benzoquinol methylase/aryl carrier-like protein
MSASVCAPTGAVAVVGIGCRFPGGADSPESFWNLLSEGRNAIGELPPARRAWQSAARRGGFLEGVDGFDASFFGVSASEARCMDPQQRLLLEVAWEAMEDAGIDPQQLAGRRVGVFVGTFTNDYELLQSRGGAAGVGPYFGTGTSSSMLAGRLSYRFGLTGPALVLNTACSSSLVALHLARRSLLSGESELALVAGVNLILSDEISAAFEAAGMLAPDAQCKPWDSAANGYVRSEGCAALLLERLPDAQARGARIWARAVGSAVNQDGASGGITAPSAAAQQRLIEAALREAALAPHAVQVVEAHGTGTPVGDPIECEALAQVFGGREGRAQPLLLGSVKGNLGHTEAAAGLAGLIKVVLAMRHGRLPATVNHRTLNPELRLERIPAHIPTAPTPWPADGQGLRVAGVNSFGFSGTNAHVILVQHAQDEAGAFDTAPPPHLLCLSGPTPQALAQLACRYEAFLPATGADALGAVCVTAAAGRQHFRHRLAVQGASAAELAAALAAYREGRAGTPWQADAARGAAPRVAFLFTGQGAQHWGMGRELFQTDPVFRQTLHACDERLAPLLGRSLVELLLGEHDTTEALAQTRCTQPALFALQVSLLRMVQAWGVTPAAVLGHSVGEFAAAVAAGVMSLEDGLALVAARGRLMQALPGGAMSAVQAGAAEVQALLAGLPGPLSVAVVNGPQACVVAGTREAVAAAHERLSARDIGFVALEVSHAFHTPMLRDMVEPFAAELRQARLQAPSLPFYSTVTGRLAGQELARPEYWCEQLVRPVQYLDAVRQLDADGFDACLELGPSPVLVNLARHCCPESRAVWLGTQQKGRPGRAAAMQAAARLFTLGVRLDHARLAAMAPRVVSVPTYPFQRKPYWIEPPQGAQTENPTQGARMTPVARTGAEQPLAPADAKAILKDYYKDLSARVRQADAAAAPLRPFIRFAPFEAPVPGFTWLPTFLGRPMAAPMQARVDQAHAEMRAVLFGGIDFPHVRRVVDIGCGYATDLIELAQTHGHLVLDGCNISEDQIDYGRRAIARVGLEGRVKLHHLDSARNEFPGLYDLVVSHQVIHHIHDKDAVLRNIAEHLRKGGLLVAAEILSNLEERIDHDPSSAHFETRQNWAALLSNNHLRLLRCVDASQEIANYLHDDDFARTVRELAGPADESTVAHLYGPHQLGQLLRRGVASYMLLLVERDYLSTAAALLDENLQRLEQPTPYAQARARLAGRPACAAPAAPAPAPAPAYAPAPTPVYAAAVPVQAPAPVFAPAAPVAPPAAAVAPVAAQPAAGAAGAEQIAAIVGLLLECAPEALDPQQTLVAQGLNSILAMDLSRRLKNAFGLSVTVKALLNGASLASLARSLSGTGTAAAADVPPRPAQPVPAPVRAAGADGGYAELLNNLGSLGEAEINRLLAQLESQREPSL